MSRTVIFGVSEFAVKQVPYLYSEFETVIPTAEYKTDANPPFPVTAINTIVPTRIVTSFGLVPSVLLRSRQTQVFNPVVTGIAVYMVEVNSGPQSMDHSPHYAVDSVPARTHVNKPIWALDWLACLTFGLEVNPGGFTGTDTDQTTCFDVIPKKGAKIYVRCLCHGGTKTYRTMSVNTPL